MAPRYTSSDESPSPLGEPLPFASGLTAKNRFLKAPMGEALATWSLKDLVSRGKPTQELVELYKRWGEGDHSWGVIVTGNVDTRFDQMSAAGDMAITQGCQPEGDRFEKFKELAAAAKANGSLIVAQVTHPGRQVPENISPIAVAPSDVQLAPNGLDSFGKPHAATKDEIDDIVRGFAHAAAYLEKAGFDGVELHGAHGYLISQFLSRTTNLRTDEYGTQTVENRLRFLTDIIRAIKARVSPNFIVSAKLNSVEFQNGGVTPEEAKEVCQKLEDLGVDFVELSGGTYEKLGMSWEKESTKKREAYFLEFAEKVIQASGADRKMKMYITGGLRSVGAMVGALNVVDGVGIGRPAAAEPRLAHDILHGRIRGAIRPVGGYEHEIQLGLPLATSQIGQIGRGQAPVSSGDAEAMEQFSRDMQLWVEKRIADGKTLEFVRAVEYSGPLKAYESYVSAEC